MADEFGQRVQGLYAVGDTPVATDKHFAVYALDNAGDYAYLNLDGSGNLNVNVASGSGGSTQYNVQDVAGATDTGTVAIGVRDDVLTTLTASDGDYARLRVNSVGALWAEITNASIVVTATDLDIRDLDGATDTVNLSDGTNTLAIDASGFLTTNINGTVAATQSGVWNIGTLTGITNDVNIADGGNSITVDAVDLDIRNLSASQDNVAISDGTNTLAVEADGSINVNAQLGATDSVYTYGSATLVKDTIGTVVTVSPAADEQYAGVSVSGAGYCEWTLEFGATASPAIIMSFWTTPSNPTQYIDLPDYLTVSSGETIRVRATNREKKPSTGSDFTGHATLIRKA